MSESQYGDFAAVDRLKGVLGRPLCLIHRLALLRDMLVRGDLRLLYLARLACCYESDQLEPPVPDGLAERHAALEAAAQAAPEPPAAGTSGAERRAAEKWLGDWSRERLEQVAERLLLGDPATVKVQLLPEAVGPEEGPAEAGRVAQQIRN